MAYGLMAGRTVIAPELRWQPHLYQTPALPRPTRRQSFKHVPSQSTAAEQGEYWQPTAQVCRAGLQ